MCARPGLLVIITVSQSYCFTPQKIKESLQRLDLWAEWLRDCSSLPVRGSFLQNVPISSLTHPPSYSLGTRGIFPYIKTARCMKLTTDLNLVSWLRMSRAIPPLPHVLPWHVQWQLYLQLYGECFTSLCKNMDSFTYRIFCDREELKEHVHIYTNEHQEVFQASKRC